MGKKDTEIGADIGITADVKDAVTNINKLGSSLSRIDSQLKAILTHFDSLNKMSLDNVTPKHFVHSGQISMSSESGREKGFKEYQKAVTEETKAITDDVKERQRLRERNTKAVEERIKNERERIRKAEDRDSEAFKEERRMRAEAKLLNAKANQSGRLLRSPRYQAGRAFENIGQKAGTIGVGSDKIEGKLLGGILSTLGTTLRSPIAGTAAALTHLTNGITELGRAAVTAYAEIESIKTQLGVVFSNQTQANTMFNEISAYAVKSPFGVQQTSELAVLLKQSGVYASDLMDTLKMIGDTAGGNVEKMKRIANNYAQIVSIGKASMLDMRQFAYAGIPIFEAVSKELGVSQQELRKLISDGKITADIIEKVFKDLTGINGIFENATEKGAKTLKARLQNLADAKQLAMGEIGEFVVNTGAKTGNDSYANQIVTGIENIYTWLQEHVETKNIAKDVEIIANREDRIQKLESLIEYNKVWGTSDVVAGLEEILAQEKAKRDPDKERATYVEAYKKARSEFEKYYNSNELMKISELEIKIKEQEDKISRMTNKTLGATAAEVSPMSSLSPNGMPVPNFAFLQNAKANVESNENINAAKEYLAFLKDLRDAIKDSNKIQSLWVQAIREDTVINAQQLAFDQGNKLADSKNSLNASFNELYEIWKNSDEQKEKEEKERIKRLEDAKELLKKLVENTDPEGNVNFGSMTREEYQNYRAQGAFNPEEKLNVVTGKNNAEKAQNRAILESQFAHNVGVVLDELTNSKMFGSSLVQNMTSVLNKSFLELATKRNDDEFFKQFAVTFSEINNSLSEMAKYDKDNAGFYESLKEYVTDSTIRWSVRKGGENADLTTEEKKGTNTEFIPLWKRILSQYTGLTTNGMTDTLSTMKNYRDDMAIRNMTGDVLKAAMKTNGVDSAMSLIRTNRSIQLAGDNGKTFQVDWKETKKAIHDFATQLSSSTEVISAYKKGLEEELNVYQELIAAGYTQAESTDLGSQKFVTSKQLEKLGLGNQSQLVNAFGEYLETESGKRYSTSDVSYRNGQFIDKLGNPIQESVKVTGNLFDFIKKELPRIYKELQEANAAEINNKFLEDLVNKTASSSLVTQLLNTQGATPTTRFLASNPDYINSSLESVKNALALQEEFEFFQKYNITQIQNFATSNTTQKGLKSLSEKFIRILFDTVIHNAENLLDSNQYQNLTNLYNNLDKDNALNTEILKLNTYRNSLNSNNKPYTSSGSIITPETSLKPEDYSGGRGFRNYLLKYSMGSLLGERNYDIEDLYLRAARTANSPDTPLMNQYGIDSRKYEGKSDEEILNGLESQEKAWIRINEAQTQSLETLHEYANSMTAILGEFAMDSWQKPFEKMGENLALGQSALEGMDEVYKNLSVELVKASGEAMVKAGWELVARGAASNSKSMIAGGLGLVAAGGFASGLGSALLNNDSDDDSDDDTEKLSKLKDQLADLLKQAREDAIYYENTLRHKKALSANSELTVKSVHDAVITPRGDVVTTDPKDYLIATKTPRTLVGGGAPSINFNVIDKSTGIKVTQQKSTYNAQTNTVDFEAIIESKVSEFIATSKGDDAFAARQSRLNGKSVIA